MHHAMAPLVQHDKHQQEPKRGSRHDEEIDRRQTTHMVPKATWFRRPHGSEGHMVPKATWFRRNVRQVCDGGLGCRIMYLETAAWLISIPSLRRSPWTRGAPHSGFSRVMRRISVLTSPGTGGRPRRRGRHFHAHRARKPLWCQAITVSGLTMTTASRHRGQRRYSKSQIIRSSRLSLTRAGRVRWRTSS